MKKIQDKIFQDLDSFFVELKRIKSSNKKIVFTNGCFDIIHKGHVIYLEKAKELADYLIIGVNSDMSVKRLKGETRPINPVHDRMYVLASHQSVDFVIKFEDDTPLGLINIIEPDFLVKGGDYEKENIVGSGLVIGKGGQVLSLPFIKGHSTTQLENKIKNL